MVVGNPASGKSTFAAGLGNKFTTPVIHSDVALDRAGGDKARADDSIILASREDSWIIEGMFFAEPGFEEVISRADHMFAFRLDPVRAVARHVARNWRVLQGREVRVGRDEVPGFRTMLLNPLSVGGQIVRDLVEIPCQVDTTLKTADRLGVGITVFRDYTEASGYLTSVCTDPSDGFYLDSLGVRSS